MFLLLSLAAEMLPSLTKISANVVNNF